MEKNDFFCEDCLKDEKIICKRDPDVKCLICGANLCGGHIAGHLRTHCVVLDLKHCSEGTQNDEDFFQRIVPDFIAMCKEPDLVTLVLDKMEAWYLMANLQLALKHPDNTGESIQNVKKIVIDLQTRLATTPALKELAEEGWK